MDSSMVAYDARRAPSTVLMPDCAARKVTEEGTYTDPAHSPIMDTSRNAAFSSVRLRYSSPKSA